MNEHNCENFIVSTMRWSFSRLNSFDTGCRYEWYKHYIECEPAKDGFFGAYGSFCHSILEKYAKGELSLFEISQYYEDNFATEIPYDAPPNKYTDIKQDYYDKGLDYFDNIDLPIDEYEIAGVEHEVDFNIDKYPFVGFIDLLLKDKDGKFILCDHKSSSLKVLKSGKISKSDQTHFLAFKRQQYLYTIPLIEKYGEGCVKELWWNMFRNRGWIKIPFNQEEYQEAKDWALDTIHRIEKETEWPPKPEFFYCWNLCSLSFCEYKA